MKKTLTILILAASTAMASGALAEDDCHVPMVDWQPRAALVQLAEKNGWTVRRIKIDDGCYEIVGQDGEGRKIKVKVHPASLDILEIDYHDDDHGRRDRDRRPKG